MRPGQPAPDPIAMRRAMDAAVAAGAPVSVLTMLAGNQIAKVITTLLEGSPMPLRHDLVEEQLNPEVTEDGWTLTVRWDRPTADDIEKAASMGIGRESQPQAGKLPIALGGPPDVEVIR
jgi:hypothetical protein